MQLKRLYFIFSLLVTVNCLQAQLNEKVFDKASATKERNRVLYGYNRFINKLPFPVKDSVVTFLLRNNPRAKSVSLCGSFSNWSPITMTKTDSGWVALAKLPEGKNLYKFVIDKQWTVDNENSLTENDVQGNTYSVYFKPNVTFRLQGFAKTKNVCIAASFNNWKPDELPMSKTTSGWEITLYLSEGTYNYKFRADDKWHHDPNNYQRLDKKAGIFGSVINIGHSNLIRDFAYYQNQLAFNEEAGDDLKMVDAIANIGYAYARMNDHPNAIRSFQKAETVYKKLNDHSAAADMVLHIAEAYRGLSDLSHELEYLQKATRQYEKTNDLNGLAKAYRLTGYYYLNLRSRPTAISYFQRSLDLYKQLAKQKEMANLLGDLGHTYLLTHDTAKVLPHLQQALSLNHAIGNKPGIAKDLWVMGDYYLKVEVNIRKALDYLQRSMDLFGETGNQAGVAQVLINIAEVYLLTSDHNLITAGIPPVEKYARAIANQKKAQQIFEDLLPESEQLWTLYKIYETYEKMGKLDSTLHYFKRYVGMYEKLLSTDKQKEVVRLETKYEYEKKGDSLKLQQFLSDEKLQKQLLFARQQKQQLELNEAQLFLSNKEKDVQRLAFLKTQSDLENEKLVKQQKEKENQLQTVQVKSLTQKNRIIQLNQQRQWIYIIGIFLLLAVGSLYFIYRSRLRSVRLETQLIKEKAEQEKKETEFQHKLADISMSALRSQMNPHFIFNCLNSIKLYTVQNDTAAASEYLTKFSKLIRLVLENSRNERITLTSEIKALELYIQMEAMRFKEKLCYTITVSDDVETDYIEIPPLLLQPYVENAIWHGLMHKEEGGQIAIAVTANEEQSLLAITITDDGIGRAKAAEIKSKTVAKHRSYAMKATSDRIALINHVYKTGANVAVQDLVDAEGQPAGTEVTIQIPI
jgi:tetratricopeptide (TPR) repeat protein